MLRTEFVARAMRVNLVAAAVASCFAPVGALANPTGGVVVNGTVSMSAPLPGQLSITNSPNSIINWQGFSIAPGELTQFIQQSAASAVLNRVVTSSPSDILGMLQSNGRVFLINPNGIVFGSGAFVDVAGLVASSLNLSDADFLSGNFRFQAVPGAGSVVNEGQIASAPGGQVYLVGPAVTNGGLIYSPQGEVVLAAGNSVELMNTGTPGLSVAITAPANQALNIGQITSESGRIGIFAGLIRQEGIVAANSAVFGADGSIKLVATDTTTFTSGSSTAAGALDIDTGGLVVEGSVITGPQTIHASGAVVVRNEPGSSAELRASGGQSIHARSLEVHAQSFGGAAVMNENTGAQTITLAGGPGLDVHTSAGGGFAQIFSSGPDMQTIAVSDADHIRIDGAGGGTAVILGNAQSISITGGGANAMRIGSPGALGASVVAGLDQSATAGLSGQSGSVTITGSAANGSISGFISNPGSGNQSVSTSGALTIVGGTASAQPTAFPAGMFHNGTGLQSVAAQSIAIHGGGTGSGNSSQIGANNGTQWVSAGDISLVGGAAGAGNNAQIRANAGQQTIIADQVSLAAGAGGTNNFVTFTAPAQDITVSGNLTIAGGGSVGTPGVGGGVRIGGRGGAAATPTDLDLFVGGNLTMSGGSVAGAAIGSSTNGGQPTIITIDVGGDVTLSPGTGADADIRLGSPTDNVAAGDIAVTAGGAIALNSAGPDRNSVIRTLGNVTLTAREITQGPDARIEAGSLAVDTTQGVALIGANAVSELSASYVGFNDAWTFNNTSPLLTVTGVDAASSLFDLVQDGDLRVTGIVLTGPQNVSATGTLSVVADASSSGQLSAVGGQMISARAMEVTAQDDASAFVSNSQFGDQIITISGGGASSGLDVRTLPGTGVAIVSNDAFGGAQTIRVTDADHIAVEGIGSTGASITAFGGTQVISITGSGANAINIGSAGAQGFSNLGASHQSMTAGAPGESGSITIIGSDGNERLAGLVSQPGAGNSQTVSTTGALTIIGGNASAQPTNFPAGLFHNGTGQQTVTAQSILIKGGASGSGNSSQIGANNGTQLVNAGTVTLVGGSAGAGNSAQIRANLGQQTIVAEQLALVAGAGGTNNFAALTAPAQVITLLGDLTMSGGGSLGTPGVGGGARIGGRGGAAATPTNLALTVGGNVTLNGGTVAGAAIGSSSTGGQPTQITMNVGGNVTLNPGAVAGAGTRLGSPADNMAGGEIIVNAGGTIALNSAAPGNAAAIRTTESVTLRANSIVQGADSQIQANSLAIETVNGATLAGANTVNGLNALNTSSGAVAFNNTSPLLTVTGVNQVASSPLMLSQSGNLLVTGNVSSGAQSIGATGDITVAPFDGQGVSIDAAGAQTISAGGTLHVQGGSATHGHAQINAAGPVYITVGSDLALTGGDGLGAHALLFGNSDLNLVVGGAVRLNAGAGKKAWARIQTETRDAMINIHFPNLSAGGIFVNGIEGALRKGQTGLLSGNGPAVRGRTLNIDYGQ